MHLKIRVALGLQMSAMIIILGVRPDVLHLAGTSAVRPSCDASALAQTTTSAMIDYRSIGGAAAARRSRDN